MCIGIRNSVWINICCAEMCLVEYVQRDKKKILGKNHDESSMQEKYKKGRGCVTMNSECSATS